MQNEHSRVTAQGWTGMYILVDPSLSTKFIKNSHQNFPVSQCLGIKLDMLFETAKSIEIVILLGKQLFYLKIFNFMPKHYSVATFVHKFTKKYNFVYKLA